MNHGPSAELQLHAAGMPPTATHLGDKKFIDTVIHLTQLVRCADYLLRLTSSDLRTGVSKGCGWVADYPGPMIVLSRPPHQDSLLSLQAVI